MSCSRSLTGMGTELGMKFVNLQWKERSRQPSGYRPSHLNPTIAKLERDIFLELAAVMSWQDQA